jgi:II/X family phage/plasmid replication protein
MIDTVRLASPPLPEALIERIEQQLVLRSALDLSTGDLQWQFTRGSLSGSWDSRVSVQVEREEWVHGPLTLRGITEEVVTGKKQLKLTCKLPCEPYLVIEGSVHKALLGHNVYGGPLPPALTMAWFVDNIAERLGVTLPYSEDWRVLRIDWAEAFDLGSFEAVQEYISGLNMAAFPRREVVRHGSESLFAPGRTTTIKAYHKGPEFSAHDYGKLRKIVDPGELIALQDMANRILRVETSIKARKLAEDHSGKPQVVQVTQAYLEGVHDREAARLLKEAAGTMETVRTHREVSRRLQSTYQGELGNRLFGTWLQLAALGEKEVKRDMAARTFYRQRKQLIDAGCSWAATDVIILKTSAVPQGFSPVRYDRRRLTEEAEQVKLQLYSYSRAA